MIRNVAVRALIAAIAVFVVCLFLVDWNALTLLGPTRHTDDATLEGDLTQLRTRVGGYVAHVPVRDFQAVRKGDLLYAIDDRDYRARADQARAQRDAAAAQLDLAGAQIVEQEAQLDVARAQIAAEQASATEAREERAREASLRGTESFLARNFETALATDLRQSRAVDAAREALRAAAAQLDVLRARRDQLRASLAASQAALELAQIELSYTRIEAPFHGRVAARLIREGDYVAPGAALISVARRWPVWAVANFREVALTRMRPGDAARITVDAIPGVVFHGHVDSIAPQSQANGSPLPPNRAVGNFTYIVQRVPVKIVFDDVPADLQDRLLVGLSVETYVDTKPQ